MTKVEVKNPKLQTKGNWEILATREGLLNSFLNHTNQATALATIMISSLSGSKKKMFYTNLTIISNAISN